MADPTGKNSPTRPRGALFARLDYAWRIVGTGLSWVIFALAALTLALVVLPLSRLFHRARGTESGADLRAQRTIHRWARAYLALMETFRVLELRTAEVQALRVGGPHLIAASHPTLLDVVYLLSVLPQADCIVSSARADNLFLTGVARAAGYLRNDSGQAAIDECAKRLAQGRTVIIFPEGTRSPAGAIGPLMRGVARIALQAGCDIQPVLITSNPPALAKGQKWYDIPERRFTVVLRALEPISTAAACEAVRDRSARRSIAARALTAELRESFAKGLEIVA